MALPRRPRPQSTRSKATRRSSTAGGRPSRRALPSSPASSGSRWTTTAARRAPRGRGDRRLRARHRDRRPGGAARARTRLRPAHRPSGGPREPRRRRGRPPDPVLRPRAGGVGMRPVNLIPPEQRRGEGAPTRTGALAYVVVGVLALVLAGVTARSSSTRRSPTRRRGRDARGEAAESEARAESLSSFTTFQQIHDARIATVIALATSRFDWQRVLGSSRWSFRNTSGSPTSPAPSLRTSRSRTQGRDRAGERSRAPLSCWPAVAAATRRGAPGGGDEGHRRRHPGDGGGFVEVGFRLRTAGSCRPTEHSAVPPGGGARRRRGAARRLRDTSSTTTAPTATDPESDGVSARRGPEPAGVTRATRPTRRPPRHQPASGRLT